MNTQLLSVFCGAGLAAAASAQAGKNPLAEPGSLLLFHEFDNRVGVANLITVTNVADGDDDVWVEYVYRAKLRRVGETDVIVPCLETNRTRKFTPKDTLSVLTKNDNPNYTAGYLYVFAKSGQVGPAINHDFLIGNDLVIDGLGVFDYSVNPVVFKAGDGSLPGDPTDLENGVGDGIRDLDGHEYVEASDVILIPRFIGQSTRMENFLYGSELILINLTGGSQFDATLDFLIYNDNEEALSAQYTFRCWEKTSLLNISGVFANEFLLTTDHDDDEIPGADHIKTGWIQIDGSVASSTTTDLPDPAFLAVLVEKVGSFKAADLPFATGTQDNGDLLPLSVNGDTVNNP